MRPATMFLIFELARIQFDFEIAIISYSVE